MGVPTMCITTYLFRLTTSNHSDCLRRYKYFFFLFILDDHLSKNYSFKEDLNVTLSQPFVRALRSDTDLIPNGVQYCANLNTSAAFAPVVSSSNALRQSCNSAGFIIMSSCCRLTMAAAKTMPPSVGVGQRRIAC